MLKLLQPWAFSPSESLRRPNSPNPSILHIKLISDTLVLKRVQFFAVA